MSDNPHSLDNAAAPGGETSVSTTAPTTRGGRGKTPPPGNVPAELSLARGNVLLVGTGSFGVNLLPTWTMLLPKWYGWTIRVCLTEAGAALVSRDTLAATTKSPVWGPEWNTREGCVPHMELASWADLILVAPATANFVAKCAHGIADNLALAVVISTDAPVIIAPALPEQAVSRPSTQRNFKLLEEDGHTVIPPQFGTAAHDGRTTPGGMANLAVILNTVGRVLDERRGTDAR